jgi:hypothetical protein
MNILNTSLFSHPARVECIWISHTRFHAKYVMPEGDARHQAASVPIYYPKAGNLFVENQRRWCLQE